MHDVAYTRLGQKKGLFQVTWEESLGSVGRIFFSTTTLRYPKIERKSVKMVRFFQFFVTLKLTQKSALRKVGLAMF